MTKYQLGKIRREMVFSSFAFSYVIIRDAKHTAYREM